jgi:hypothetical protein
VACAQVSVDPILAPPDGDGAGDSATLDDVPDDAEADVLQQEDTPEGDTASCAGLGGTCRVACLASLEYRVEGTDCSPLVCCVPTLAQCSALGGRCAASCEPDETGIYVAECWPETCCLAPDCADSAGAYCADTCPPDRDYYMSPDCVPGICCLPP